MTRDEEIQMEQEELKTQAEWEKHYIVNNEISDDEAQKVTPLDLVRGLNNYTDKEIRNERYDVCKGCEFFFNPMKMCRQCGCTMPLKTWLKAASCPAHKWEATNVGYDGQVKKSTSKKPSK